MFRDQPDIAKLNDHFYGRTPKGDGRMNRVLRVIAFLTGVVLLLVSIYWSQDGFNFDVAGESGYGDMAVKIGYVLAISVTVIQFVFSTNFKELNASLILFGILAYAYSIYTNYQGILHFQGGSTNNISAFILGLCMDGIPEPLIGWALRESLSGDFIGNLLSAVGKGFGAIVDGPQQPSKPAQQAKQPNYPVTFPPVQSKKNKQKGSERRHFLESGQFGRSGQQSDKPKNRFFGE